MAGTRRLGAWLLAGLALPGTVAFADTAPPSHDCHPPLKQTHFATQFQLESYRASVDLYRTCLEAFVKAQEQEIERRRQAAQGAIDEWNRFVGKEAKGPPSAPEDAGKPKGEERKN